MTPTDAWAVVVNGKAEHVYIDPLCTDDLVPVLIVPRPMDLPTGCTCNSQQGCPHHRWTVTPTCPDVATIPTVFPLQPDPVVAALLLRAEEAETRLAAIDTGCWNCGGLPHTAECRVRDTRALWGRIERAESEALSALRAVRWLLDKIMMRGPKPGKSVIGEIGEYIDVAIAKLETSNK